jgi:hypothetical protein
MEPLHKDPMILQPAVEVREAAEPVDVEWEDVNLDTGEYAGEEGFIVKEGKKQVAKISGLLPPIRLSDETHSYLMYGAAGAVALGLLMWAYSKFGTKNA